MTKRAPPALTVRSRRLAAILREKRLAAGLSAAEAARRADLSDQWIYRAEKPATCHPEPNNVWRILQVYGVTGETEIRHVVDLAREAGRLGWWHDYDLSSAHATFVALEAEARQEHVWESALIPGLLQVPAYAREVIAAGPDVLPPARVGELVKVRAERQKILHREDPLALEAIIDEAVLHRVVGGPALMRDQLAHLLHAAEEPNVTIQVRPAGAGAHPAMTGPFTVLRYPDDGDHDVLFCEAMTGPVYAEEPRDIERADRAFSHLRALSLPPGESMGLIAKVAVSL